MSGDERHTTRRTRQADTTKLGSLQRRVLEKVFHLMWDAAMQQPVPNRVFGEEWVRWQPKQHVDDVTPASSAAVSKALSALEERRLMMVRRNPGGRAHSVRLSEAGVDYVISLLDGTAAHEERRRKRSAGLPAPLRRAIPKLYQEYRTVRRSSPRHAQLGALLTAYREYIDGTDGQPELLTRLYVLFDDLTS